MNVPTVKTRGLASCYAWAGRRAAAGVVRWRRSRAARDVDVCECARGCPVVASRDIHKPGRGRGDLETPLASLQHFAYTCLLSTTATIAQRDAHAGGRGGTFPSQLAMQ